ncbi:hypothetical protein HK100_004029 [Physocladia obscura]|uniref:Aminotransferase class V domain-containing protein n=1 Tax=Physocladia obscura TaxID=109957 RepID=A0AAD5SZ90_9FUNG|nr:hypothetical protein HK100_004029 [Physocladia obscura]
MDESFARSHFPAIRNNDGQFAFMDNAGGSAVLESVAQRVAEYLVASNAQLGASYPTSQLSTKLVEEAKIAGQRFVNASSPEEVVLGISTTQLLENLARAMEPYINDLDEIIITNTDHEANIGPFVRLAKRRNLTLKFWTCNENLELDLSTLKSLLTENTRFVAVTHCSNILGTVNNIPAIAQLVHTIPGAEICVDGVAYAPHRAIDVQALGVDYYCFSWYKVYGPHISQLFTAKRTFSRLSSLAHFFIDPESHPYSLQPGNVNYELSSSLPAILGYIGDLGRSKDVILGTAGQKTVRADNGATRQELAEYEFYNLIAFNENNSGFSLIEQHEQRLADKLLSYLALNPTRYRILGHSSTSHARVPTISFLVSGIKSEDFVRQIDQHGLGIRFGHFYAYRLVCEHLKLTDDGIVRVSLVHYNTVEEVDKLIAAFENIISDL